MKSSFYSSILSVSMLCLLIVLPSCNNKKIKELEEENSYLKHEVITSDSLQIQFMNAYAEIEYNINEIKIKEKIISDNTHKPDLDANTQQKIMRSIEEIGKRMEDNRKKIQKMDNIRAELIKVKKENTRYKGENNALRKEISKLYEQQNANNPSLPSPNKDLELEKQIQLERERLAAENQRNSESSKKIEGSNEQLRRENKRLEDLNQSLNEMITRLQNQVKESEARIESLQEELFMMKEAYTALQKINDSLKIQTNFYREDNEKKEILIQAQSEKLSSGFYFIGSSKEIKSKNLILKSGLNPNSKDSEFTRLNIYENKIIETKSKKMKILTQHPENSYTINAKDKENIKIEIKNPDLFWKNSKYLVVLTK